MKVTLSKKNSKMGNVMSVSFPPVVSCVPGVPCSTSCYAKKSYIVPNRPVVRRAWDGNFEFAKTDQYRFFEAINAELHSFRKPKEAFRWFVGGDIPDQLFVAGMDYIARDNPATRFLAFTKNHALDFSGRAGNLVIVRSMWPYWGNPDLDDLPRAWMQDGTETRIPEGAFHCSHRCDSCFLCWHLPERGRDVVFGKH